MLGWLVVLMVVWFYGSLVVWLLYGCIDVWKFDMVVCMHACMVAFMVAWIYACMHSWLGSMVICKEGLIFN